MIFEGEREKSDALDAKFLDETLNLETGRPGESEAFRIQLKVRA